MVASERRLVVGFAGDPKSIVKCAVGEFGVLGPIWDEGRVDILGGVVAVNGQTYGEMPVVAGDPPHRVGMDVSLATIDRIAYAEANSSQCVHHVETSAGVALIHIREAADAKPAAVGTACRPSLLAVLVCEEAHCWCEEVAGVGAVEEAVATITDTSAVDVPAVVGKALASARDVEWNGGTTRKR